MMVKPLPQNAALSAAFTYLYIPRKDQFFTSFGVDTPAAHYGGCVRWNKEKTRYSESDVHIEYTRVVLPEGPGSMRENIWESQIDDALRKWIVASVLCALNGDRPEPPVERQDRDVFRNNSGPILPMISTWGTDSGYFSNRDD